MSLKIAGTYRNENEKIQKVRSQSDLNKQPNARSSNIIQVLKQKIFLTKEQKKQFVNKMLRTYMQMYMNMYVYSACNYLSKNLNYVKSDLELLA